MTKRFRKLMRTCNYLKFERCTLYCIGKCRFKLNGVPGPDGVNSSETGSFNTNDKKYCINMSALPNPAHCLNIFVFCLLFCLIEHRPL